MISRLIIALLAGTLLVWSGTNLTVAQNGETKAPETAPEKRPPRRRRRRRKKEAPKAEQKKAQSRRQT
jgi:hypothetical protein